MEMLMIALGFVVRIAVPLGLLLWASGRVKAWDQQRRFA